MVYACANFERTPEEILMNQTDFDYGTDTQDAEYDELLEKRANTHIRRGKVTKRRKSPKNANATGSPGGIRQRRNKRWAW